MSRDNLSPLLTLQMKDVQERYPSLALLAHPSTGRTVRGRVGFTIDHKGRTVVDEFDIELRIPNDYPDSPPVVFETTNEILNNFNHVFIDGRLCLGAPVEVRAKFSQTKKLINFLDEQVIPFLFMYSYKRDYGELPFGERSHGILGVMEYYVEYFGVSFPSALKLLKNLADDFAPPLAACPCGGGKKLRHCHGPKLAEIRAHQKPNEFESELRSVIKLLQQSNTPCRKFMSRRMLRRLNRKRRR